MRTRLSITICCSLIVLCGYLSAAQDNYGAQMEVDVSVRANSDGLTQQPSAQVDAKQSAVPNKSSFQPANSVPVAGKNLSSFGIAKASRQSSSTKWSDQALSRTAAGPSDSGHFGNLRTPPHFGSPVLQANQGN